MTPRKLKLLICTFSYAGNGGFKSQIPAVGDFKTRVILAAHKDPRIDDQVGVIDLADTPITMSRNKAVLHARQIGADVILMIDSDQVPDMYLGKDTEAVPFFESSFDFLYANYDRFPKGCVIGSPYCGPPVEEENVYVFRWTDFISNTPDPNFSIAAYSRAEAAMMTGIHPVAALPTGLILFDTRVFELTEPLDIATDSSLTLDVEKERWRGWFYYEWKNKFASEKASTEDVVATRDICLAGLVKHDYNPVFCNWSSWAGHYKPKEVGKPQPLASDYVSSRLREAVLKGARTNERMICLQPAEYATNVGERMKQEPLLKSNMVQRYVDTFCGVDPDSFGKPLSEVEKARWNDYQRAKNGSGESSRPMRSAAEAAAEGNANGNGHALRQLAENIADSNGGVEGFAHAWEKSIVEGPEYGQLVDSPTLPDEFIRPGGFWTATKDLNALASLVHRLAQRFPDRPLEILEVGSFVGGSALALEKGFGSQGGTVYCVDTWEGSESDMTGEMAKQCDLYATFCHNVNLGRTRLNKSIVPIVGKSVEVAKAMNRTFDLVFIDADHEYESVVADLKAWLPLVREGGIFCGHDYGVEGFEGVKLAVDEILSQSVRTAGESLWMSMVSHRVHHMLQPETIA